MDRPAARPTPRVEQPRCPYCHEEVPLGAPQQACATCRAWHHAECWSESGGRCAACRSSRAGVQDSEPVSEEPPYLGWARVAALCALSVICPGGPLLAQGRLRGAAWLLVVLGALFMTTQLPSGREEDSWFWLAVSAWALALLDTLGVTVQQLREWKRG